MIVCPLMVKMNYQVGLTLVCKGIKLIIALFIESSEVWDDNDTASETEINDTVPSNCPSLPNFDEHSTEHHHSNALSRWLIGFLITLQAKFYFPDNALNLLIRFLSVFFVVLGRFSSFMKLLASYFPSIT